MPAASYLSIVAKHLERHIEQQVMPPLETGLWNWGRWLYRDTVVEINRATGAITQSPSATIMRLAPVRPKNGYSAGHTAPIDSDAAEAMDVKIRAVCTPRQRSALAAYYAYRSHDPGNDGEKKARKRARRALAGFDAALTA